MGFIPGVVPVSVQRASAVLAAAGAWDTDPEEVITPGCSHVTVLCRYVRGGAAGAFDIRIEVSEYSTDAGTLGVGIWHDVSIEQLGAFAAGADVASDLQRSGHITYTATGAAAESVAYELQLSGIERIRIGARESGNVGAPGTLEIVCSLTPADGNGWGQA